MRIRHEPGRKRLPGQVLLAEIAYWQPAPLTTPWSRPPPTWPVSVAVPSSLWFWNEPPGTMSAWNRMVGVPGTLGCGSASGKRPPETGMVTAPAVWHHALVLPSETAVMRTEP